MKVNTENSEICELYQNGFSNILSDSEKHSFMSIAQVIVAAGCLEDIQIYIGVVIPSDVDFRIEFSSNASMICKYDSVNAQFLIERIEK